jgi:MFS family permease
MNGVRGFASAVFGRYVAALEFPEFRTMWLAHLSAQAAGWALIVARGWFVFDLTQSSWAVGLVTFAATAPMMIMPLIAGVLADRMDRRTLLASTYAINMVVTLILALLALFGVLNEGLVLGLTLVNGFARATQQSTSQALAANLVPPHRLLNALSLTAATQHMSKLIGPGLVAPILGLMGVAPAFFLCAALYGIGWLQILEVQTRTTGGIKRGESFTSSFTAGIGYAWRQPLIRMVLVMVFFHCGFAMAFESLMPAYYADQFGDARAAAPVAAAPIVVAPHDHDAPAVAASGANRQATGYASLMMAVGLGALIGSVFIGGIESSRARGRLYLVTGVFSGLGLILLAAAPSLGVAWGAAAIVGGSQAAFMTMGQALMQSLAANEYRGRLASLNLFSFGGIMAVMNLGNGALGTQFSPGSILFVDGAIFAAVMLVSLVFVTPRRVYVDGMPARTVAQAPAPAAALAR